MRLHNLSRSASLSILMFSLPAFAQRGLPQEGRHFEEHHEGHSERQPRLREGRGSEPRTMARPMRMDRFETRQERPRDQEREPRQMREWPERPERPRDRDPRSREGRSEERRPRERAEATREPARRDYAVQSRPREEARSWQRERGWERGSAWRPGGSWQGNRVDNWAAVHRTWAQRGGYGGYYIPQTTFYAYYGPQNYFSFRPTIYMGYPRFWYGNYYFLIVDPWPGEWVDDWYAYDDCYIDFIDGGYYLCNRRYPGISLAVSVML